MARYHVNPTTGEPGACSATVRCPYGDINEDHWASKEEARRAYEEAMGDSALGIAKKEAQESPSFASIQEEVTAEIQRLRQLALGSKHNRALEALEDAQFGKPSRGYNGGRRDLNPVDQIEALTKARGLVGRKGNEAAYDSINQLITRLEATEDVQQDGFYQADRALRTAKLPAGAKRVLDKEWRKRRIELGGGRFVEGTAVGADRSQTTFTLRERTSGTSSRAIGRASDLTELLKGNYDRIS